MLASGQGTNLEAILQAEERGSVAGKVVLVLSNREEAPALERARRRGIQSLFINPRNFGDRTGYDSALLQALRGENVELVVLAGFMHLLSPLFVNAFPLQILNIHPSLLPAFPGTDGVEQALNYGVKVAGCTVHFVDEGLDSGPIILQESLPVMEEDTLATLQQRIHAAEHRLYPRAVDLFCRGKLIVEGRRCRIIE